MHTSIYSIGCTPNALTKTDLIARIQADVDFEVYKW